MSTIVDAIARRARGTMLDAIGLRLLDAGDGFARAEMSFAAHLTQLTGLFHTGALLTLADSTATIACIASVDPSGAADGSDFPLAIQLSANLIRNVSAGTATAEARIVHRGRTTMVVETTVRDEWSRTLAIVTTTHLVLSAATPPVATGAPRADADREEPNG